MGQKLMSYAVMGFYMPKVLGGNTLRRVHGPCNYIGNGQMLINIMIYRQACKASYGIGTEAAQIWWGCGGYVTKLIM